MSGTFEWDNVEDQIYECVKCHHRFKGEKLIDRNRIVCPECGYRIIKKVRSPIVKKHKAV